MIRIHRRRQRQRLRTALEEVTVKNTTGIIGSNKNNNNKIDNNTTNTNNKMIDDIDTLL